jgi:hypothetical protein
MNVKTIYCCDDVSHKTELLAYANQSNQIYIEVYLPDDDSGYYSQSIVLNKKTAIRLVKDLKRQIAYINESEVGNV